MYVMMLLIYFVILHFICVLKKTSTCNNYSYQKYIQETKDNSSFSKQSKLKSEMRSFKSNKNIHKKEGGSYYVVSANKASSVTLQSPGNESQSKHTVIV